MIRTTRKHLEERCRERGYSLEEVMPCVVKQEGDLWTIDPDHPAYPASKRAGSGPGSILAEMLKGMGLAPVESCKCKGRARKMDEWGPDGCERHIEEIVDWLEEEAQKRKLPFMKWPAKTLVRVAIRRSRKAQKGR